jgi:integrase
VAIDGTKSSSAARMLDLPEWLGERLERRAEAGTGGYVFPASAKLEPTTKWDQSNSARAVRTVLDGAGYDWAVPHTFRRTVATLLNEAGIPIARIADQLGHADPSMTARVYLGRDLHGDKSDLASLL